MTARSQNSYLLLEQFREFYAEVTRLRQMVETNLPGKESASGAVRSRAAANGQPLGAAATGAGVAVAVDDKAGDVGDNPDEYGDADELTLRVWHAMAVYLDQKMYEVKLAASSISHAYLEEMAYIMAVFADEAFLCLLDWNGKSYWRDHLMELRLFRSQIAGQEIFKRIDRVIVRRDHGAEELCAVYLMVLSLGFKGQYLHNPAAVDVYRNKLFDRLMMTNPELRQESRHLIPDAYRHTVTEGSPVRLPEPRKWWLIVAAIIGGWLILSSIAWLVLTRPTRDLLAVTERSLDRIAGTTSSSLEPSRKWKELAFSQQNGWFRVELPSSLPVNNGASSGGGSTMAPLLIAVNGPGGTSAGSAERVALWLSQGSTSVPSMVPGAMPISHIVISVEPIASRPSGVTSTSTTLLFEVGVSVTAQDLGRRAQLSFPIDGENGITVQALTLYIPVDSTAGER